MGHPYWPLFDVAIRTPRLEVRYPDDSLLIELATVAAQGVHDPDEMPFLAPWTRAKSPELERSAFKHWWGHRASWTPENWHFVGAVVVDGSAVGVQDLFARSFAVTKSVTTGSWLGRAHQGQGIGKEMRAAVLHLAFVTLGAQVAYSGAFEDNVASSEVSRSFGYVENGDEIVNREDKSARVVRLKLARDRWERSRRDDIEIVGLEGCLDWFGATDVPNEGH
jgi:RimJ/RimL family protein N-acetyltransferase